MSNMILTGTIHWHLLKEDLEEHIPNEMSFYLNQVLERLTNYYDTNREVIVPKKPKLSLVWVKSDLITVEACLDRTWEMLNSGYWKDVPINYRYCYSLCSIFLSLLMEISLSLEEDNAKSTFEFKRIMQQIDKGILLGAPLPRSPNLLTNAASKFNKHFAKNIELPGFSQDNKLDVDVEDPCTTLYLGFSAVNRLVKPSMEKFFCDAFRPKVPVLMEGCLSHWRALHLWKDAEYLEKIAGHRTVPIEIGSKYTEDDWSQSLVTFSEFLKTHITKKNERVGYLAQHQLFDQIPELKNDFAVPEYCSFSDKEDGEEFPDINAWFGPSGTVSPLHYDPKNNFLTQVIGYKRVVLYSPGDSPKLYPYETRLLCNTARVDPYNPNFEEYPDFQHAKGYMCYLKPGEMLYIPPKWWHHVTSLSPSFSISFWWE
ncbi:hypothetical protein QAD02_011431 [Eretmocerus hayati]|uniref:Uncharacterized protein n=1 Tax=Eretmocerus hayati TaxID=131215 RepID=A0ACC2P1I4_9HYME|nr:hypothetical protein QAD02_011431 [Eretmocerus hayati]